MKAPGGAERRGQRLIERHGFLGAVAGLLHEIADGDEADGEDDEGVDGVNVGEGAGLEGHHLIEAEHGGAGSVRSGVALGLERAFEALLHGLIYR